MSGSTKHGLPWFLSLCHTGLAVKAVCCSRGYSVNALLPWVSPRALLRESASPSLDRCAAAWASASPGNSARDMETTMNTTLYLTDPNTVTGYREAALEEIMTTARQALNRKVHRGTGFTSPRVIADYLVARLAELTHEVFTMIYLDNHCRFIAAQDLFRGTIDGAIVHPREVVKEALKHNAAKAIFAHCHPSGLAEASRTDEAITERMKG